MRGKKSLEDEEALEELAEALSKRAGFVGMRGKKAGFVGMRGRRRDASNGAGRRLYMPDWLLSSISSMRQMSRRGGNSGFVGMRG